MKIQLRKSSETGSTLLIVMLVLFFLSIYCLKQYLDLTAVASTSMMRSSAWNAALVVAEAGAEESLSQIAKNNTNFSADGWTQSGTNSIYTKVRTNSTGYYSARISGVPGGLITVTSTGGSLWNSSSYLYRTVQVTAQTAQLPRPNGLTATNLVFKGNVFVDSYDSSNNAYRNTNNVGWYDPNKNSDLAVVSATGTNFGLSGSSHVLGYVDTAPGGSVTTKGNASVGSKTWTSKGIEPGHFTNNVTQPVPDIQPPFQSATTPTGGSFDNTSYTYDLQGGQYMAGSLSGGLSPATMVVEADSTLYVTGSIDLGKIVFKNNARLDLYVAGASISFNPIVQEWISPGNISAAAAPTQFGVWALPSCVAINMNGNNNFVGMIYAPEADMTIAGGEAIFGCLTAHSVTCAGTFDFHYDLGTANTFSNGPMTVKSWSEL